MTPLYVLVTTNPPEKNSPLLPPTQDDSELTRILRESYGPCPTHAIMNLHDVGRWLPSIGLNALAGHHLRQLVHDVGSDNVRSDNVGICVN